MTTTTTNGSSQPEPDSESQTMKIPISPTRATQLVENLQSIQSRISTALKSTSQQSSKQPRTPPRLVAVSKLKPASDILSLHNPPTSHTHFGENYVQELLEKSRLLPTTIKWHFIGGLQSNKCAQLAREVPNLWAVESVDSVKKASLLNKGRGEGEKKKKTEDGDEEDERLRVFVQVNTSGEESKSGVDPDPKSPDLLELCRYILSKEECPNLKLQGFMTIGAIARSQATTPETENEDFICLRETRDRIVKELGMEDGSEELELSMGMSEDFEGAIALGSDEVRVGSTIFGERPPKKEAKVLEETEEEKK